MKNLLLALIFFLFTSSIFAADEKPGRFFEDQPDVNDDYQIHYLLNQIGFENGNK
tara:strand:+ start:154 stop:318 length:165 start_codon:yes stop_codon:yes gene_type:complete